jgi:hypothetical protein
MKIVLYLYTILTMISGIVTCFYFWFASLLYCSTNSWGTAASAAFAEVEAALSPFPLTPPNSLNRELVNKTPPGARILRFKSRSHAQQQIRAAPRDLCATNEEIFI